MVSAHRDFIRQVADLNFAVRFYENAIGQPDLTGVVESTIEMVEGVISNADVSVFVLNSDSFEVHMAGNSELLDARQSALESCFTLDVVKEICRWVHIGKLDEMCQAGLQASPVILKSLSAAAVPFGKIGEPMGFILIHRNVGDPLLAEELESVAVITGALSSVIKSMRNGQQAF